MTDDFTLSPYVRIRKGRRGNVLLRCNETHAEQCRRAIARREHPAWSSQRVEWSVA